MVDKHLKNLAIGHCNIEGGLASNLAKTTEIKNVIFKENFDIFGLNETNLNSSIDTGTINIPLNYKLEREDRPNGSSSGGCGFIISNRLNYKLLSFNNTITNMSKIEAIWVELTDFNVNLCFFYRSKNFTPVDTFIDYMFECMMKLNGKKVIWIGDVNIDQRNLSDLQYKKLDISMKLFGMIQVVTDVTRRSYRNGVLSESTIDVVMTNCYYDFTDCKVLDYRIGDHETLKFELDFKVPKTDKFKRVLIRNHCRKNIDSLKHYLSETSDFSSIMNCDNIEAAVDGLNYHISKAYKFYCPPKIIKCNSHYIHKPSQELLTNIRIKKKLYRKYKIQKNKNPQSEKCLRLWNEYKDFKNKNVTKLSKRDRKQNTVNELKTKSQKNDLKGVWKTIKIASNLPTINSNKNSNDNLDAEVMNKFFTTVGKSIQDSLPTCNDRNSFIEYMPENDSWNGIDEFNEVTEESILEYISSIPNDKSINDEVPVKIYKHIMPSIIAPLTHIVNMSLTTGVMPTACKNALLTPVFKGEGSKDDPSNYRPISILPLLGKCIEYFVNLNIMEYVTDNNILTDRQFGFRKDNSTTYLMLELLDKIYSSKEKGKRPAVLFLDIKKAFDSVDHEILIEKLKYYGVSGKVLEWFKSYLENRYQSTKIGKHISIALLILWGIPQGSILGPILFSIFINDIVAICKNSVPFLFADDGALYFENVDRDKYSNVKNEIKQMTSWLTVNKLSLNADKTKIMIFDKKEKSDSIKIETENQCMIVKEEKVRRKKYLGLVLDHKLSFVEHIDYIKKKIAKRIGAMYKSKNLLPLKYRKMFANSLMLPYFDYLDNIWNKTYKGKLYELDVLYKKIAKIALDYDKLERSKKVYHDMKWLPLHLRRQLHLSTYMYKIINGLSPPQLRDKFMYITGGSRDGQKCNLYTKKSRTHKQFYYLGAKCWNMLPQPLRQAEDTKKFSNTLKNQLLQSIQNDDRYVVNNTHDYIYKAIE